MKKTIKKVAVLGSGIMGSRIACHFANIGLEVLLLDIVPPNLSDEEKKNPKLRNKWVNDSLMQALQSKPSPIYSKSFTNRIKTGNFDDDLHKIQACDWVIEAIVENLEIKQQLFEKVEKYRKEGTFITSNTSGIPIHLMLKGRSEDFQNYFCGTHFFNPPRYLRLLEIIPTPKTKKEVVDFFMHYGDLYLGKETVLCKDTPAFIANRVGVYSLLSTMHAAIKYQLGVSEVDKLTGPIIGHAKSATFRTSDLVGLDTTVKVAKNLYNSLTHDESRENFKLPKIINTLVEKNWLGDKSKQGFYKKTMENGKKEILELDFQTLTYIANPKKKLAILDKTKDEENLAKRLQIVMKEEGTIGQFYKQVFYDLFNYVSHRIPEITNELYRIDQAVSAGFAWEMGPFKKWDTVGVRHSVAEMKTMGLNPAKWVTEMLDAGHETFYHFEKGKLHYYDIPSKKYLPVAGSENLIILDALKSNHIVWSNEGSTLYDMGDGVLGLEFHTKMNALGAEVIEGINTAVEKAESHFNGLVIGNEAANFSAGANLAMLFMYAVDQEFDEIEMMIRQFQNTITRLRFSSIPIVAAPAGLALGGGCELSLHCDAIQAHAETYIGLVEVGVGVIPGGGGTKEFVLRASDEYEQGDPELNTLGKYFMNIATAKVATSAQEGKEMNILKPSDGITLNRARLLKDAKNKVLELYEAGYTQPLERTDIKVQGQASLAMLEAGITGMLYGNYISEHDAKIAKKLAFIMSGGNLSAPTRVSEQYLLDLEREAFLSLCGEQKTLERIQSVIFKGKPLRN